MKKGSGETSMTREEYLTIRKDLVGEKGRSSDRYDKTIITISGGALFLSMAFLERITQRSSYSHTEWLIGGWICLAVALLTSLISHLTSQCAIQKLINYVDKSYECPQCNKPFQSFSRRLTSFLNITSLVAVIVGVSLIIFFVCNQL